MRGHHARIIAMLAALDGLRTGHKLSIAGKLTRRILAIASRDQWMVLRNLIKKNGLVGPGTDLVLYRLA